MKAILASLVLMSSLVYANDCKFQNIGDRTYVYPVYVANVTYYFSKKDKEARAMVHWALDEEQTRTCFNKVKVTSNSNRVFIPTVFASSVEARVLGANEYSSIEIFPTASGHWSGTTSFTLPYSVRNKVLEAQKNGTKLVEFIADTKMRIKSVEKKTYGKFNCRGNTESAGVIELYERLGAFKKIVKSLKGADTEDVLETFLGTCVEFEPVDADSLTEFNKELKRTSKILNDQIEIKGEVEVDSYLKLPAIDSEIVSIFDV